MGWYPPGFFNSEISIRGETNDRYILIDEKRGLVWKVYVLSAAHGDVYAVDGNEEHFNREVRNNRKLLEGPHPNILASVCDGIERVSNQRYGVLWFKYMPLTLQYVIHSPSLRYTADDVLSATFQLLDGISHLHDKLKIVHRDIKPANVFIDADGVIKIADFDISVQGIKGTLKNEMGTLRYMHPDQLVSKKFHQKHDLWSMGICLWELVTRRTCFSMMTVPEIHTLHKKNEFMIPPLEGKHLIVEVIKDCSKIRSTAKELKKFVKDRAKKKELHKSRFVPTEVKEEASASAPCLPAGLESVRILPTPIYGLFNDRTELFNYDVMNVLEPTWAKPELTFSSIDE